jgi:CheY-like chemotaxis protein
MKTNLIYSKYNGGMEFLAENIDKKLLIFVVDDQEVYLNLLKDKLGLNPNHSILTFSTGEEALIYSGLKPDLLIIDYHLDGVVLTAKNGRDIANLFRMDLPGVEVVVISADHKLSFLSGISNTSEKLMFKDGYVSDRLSLVSKKLLSDKKSNRVFNNLMFLGFAVFFLIFSWAVVSFSI